MKVFALQHVKYIPKELTQGVLYVSSEYAVAGHLCACGVVFLLLATTNKLLREQRFFGDQSEPNMLQWLDLVALATVADVVPLKGLNRAFVTQGLKVMSRRDNLGLAALSDVGGLKRRPDTYALGFIPVSYTHLTLPTIYSV